MSIETSQKKRSLWPMGIIGVMGLFIVSIVSAVSVMMTKDIPLTSQDYYAKEIAYQDRIDAEKRTAAEGKIPVVTERNEQGVWIQFPGQPAETTMEGNITFFRHSDENIDFMHPIRPNSEGKQWVRLKDTPRGLWQIEFLWKEGENTYYHETQFTL